MTISVKISKQLYLLFVNISIKIFVEYNRKTSASKYDHKIHKINR